MIDEMVVMLVKENIVCFFEFGFFIELDDFGIGYFSIFLLWDLKVDWVKIDCSFVFGVDIKFEF